MVNRQSRAFKAAVTIEHRRAHTQEAVAAVIALTDLETATDGRMDSWEACRYCR